MASSLSDDEFHRMQLQLIELRTQNYTLNDNSKKQSYTITELTEKVGILDRELQKAQKTIQKSKKAKEVEALIQDNDILQRKLISQEEEFSLQSSTLMQELSSLVSKNEDFEQRLASLSAGGKPDGQHEDEREVAAKSAELVRLQAENLALQKKWNAERIRHDEELQRLQETVRVLQSVNTDLETQCGKLAGKRGTPAGDDNCDVRTVEGTSDNEECQREDEETPEEENARLRNSSFSELMSIVNQSETNSRKLQNQLHELDDIKLKYDTMQEENQLLRERLSSTERSTNDNVKVLQDDVVKLTEKLRKKQEIFLQLQEEKENMYAELSKRLDKLQESKDSETASLMQQNDRMQKEISKATQEMADYKDKTSKRIGEIEQINSNLNEKVDASSLENANSLKSQNAKLKQQMLDMDTGVAKSLQETEDLKVQLKEGLHAHQVTLQQLHDARTERDKQIQALQEVMKVAEKRKTLLDEMAIKYQVEGDDHRELIKQLEDKYRQTVRQLQSECDKYQNEIGVLEKDKVKLLQKESDKYQIVSVEHESIKVKYEELQGHVTSMEEAKSWLERRLTEVEENLKSNKNQYENDVFLLKQEHTRDLVQISDHHANEMKNLRDDISRVNTEKEALELRLDKQKQDIKDSVDNIKLRDKKAATMMKDLKRQLHAERKRNDKLQEKLQEFFSDNKNKLGVDDLFRPIDGADSFKADGSSISSWSMSGLGRESMATSASLPSPKSENSPTDTPPCVLEQDNNDLLNRLAEVQQQNWQLEERVSILEASNSAMAEDLLRKTAIIDHYVMESRTAGNTMSPSTEKITLRRMMEFVKEKGEDNTREMNKKLQNMLEETLTKNMYLQRDMEVLSEELVRLSKTPVLTSPPGDAT